MIMSKYGESIEVNGVTYTVGMNILATNESEYEGLYGQITEIRTDSDMDTENVGPDIYCAFDPPEAPEEKSRIEAVFSELYDEPKQIDDIIFDCVIMAPDMIAPVNIDEGDKANKELSAAILKFTFGFAERNK